MLSRLEVQPDQTLLVIGPGFAKSLLDKDSSSSSTLRFPPLTLSALNAELENAVKQFDFNSTSGSAERYGAQLSVLESHLRVLKKNKVLQQWLDNTFSTNLSIACIPQLQEIKKMQKEGALVAYLHVDSVIEDGLQQSGFTLDETEAWSRTSNSGILHPFGYYKQPSSLLKWMTGFTKKHASFPNEFVQVLQQRTCVYIGFEEDNTLLLKLFMQAASTYSGKLSFNIQPQNGRTVDTTACNVCLSEGLYHLEKSSKELARFVEFPPDDDRGSSRSLSFLLAAKSEQSHIMKLVGKFIGVNFVLMSNITCNDAMEYFTISLRVYANDFTSFWSQVTSKDTMAELIEHSLSAIIFDNKSILWINAADIKSAILSNNEEQQISSSTTTNSLSPLQESFQCKANNKPPIRRWFTTKQKVNNGLLTNKMYQENGTPIPPSILKRRLSLPPHLSLPPAQHIKGKTAPVHVSSRQQILISKYLFTRKYKETNSSDVCSNSKLLRQLLQEKPKKFNQSPDSNSAKMINQWIFQRRKDLFMEENSNWSVQINKVLEQKMSRWKKMKAKRKEALMIKKAEEERLAKTELTNNNTTTTTTSSLHQQLSNALSLPLSSPLLPSINPFMSLNANPLVYGPASSFLPSYPFLTTLPYVSTIVPPQVTVSATPSSNFFFPSNLTTPSGIITVPINGYANKSYTQTVTTVPSTVVMSSSSVPTDVSATPGRKRSRPSTYSYVPTATPMSPYVNGTTLQEPGTPPKKQPKMATPIDDRSDGEDSMFEGQYSPVVSPRENKIQLWQFLLDLLLSSNYSDYIQWNPYMSMEFEIKKPKEVAKLWKATVCDDSADFAKFREILQYYCKKSPPILHSDKGGKPYVYRFNHTVLYYISMRYSQQVQNSTNSLPSTATRDNINGSSQEVLVVD